MFDLETTTRGSKRAQIEIGKMGMKFGRHLNQARVTDSIEKSRESQPII